MQNVLLILVIFLLIAVLVLIGLVIYFAQKYFKDQTKKVSEPASSQITSKEKSLIVKEKDQKKPQGYCVDHPDQLAQGLCAISGDPYCENCFTLFQEIRMAKKYLDLYADSEWEEIFRIKATKENQSVVDKLMAQKKELWDEKDMPLIVQGHYKINVERDEIEVYTVLFSRKEDVDFVKKELVIFQ